jgi:hypothetical protein
MLAVACAASATFAVVASAQHIGDINPVVVSDAKGNLVIQTNFFESDGSVAEGVRVFASTFGDSGFPEFTSNPGFDAAPGTFTPGTRVGFNAPEGFLRFVGDGLLPVDSTWLNVKFLTAQVDIGPLPTPGFDLAVQSNGGWHRHLSFTLKDGVSLLPPPGIYVLPMTLYSTDPAIGESAVFYIVFDYLTGSAAQEEAMAWISEHLLGESSCLGDLDGDGAVGPRDLALLLGAWASTPAPGDGADLDGDGAVGPGDLATLLGTWGGCP